MRQWFSIFALTVCLCFATITQAEQKTVRLLTIGNSFANNALRHLPKIVEASGNKLIFARANLGGCTMQRHWNHVEKFEADANDPKGKPYHNKFSLAQQLTKDKWDYVTIQQVSYKSHDLKTYHPYAKNLYDYIQKHSPQAKILMHQIWAYRVDDPRFKPSNKGKHPHTHQVMYEQVRKAYHTVAKELNIEILPSGDAMYLADTDPKWGYKPDNTFDLKTMPQNKPEQKHSLHVGYHWRKDKKTGNKSLRMDGHHANQNGEYLIGCVWYEVLYSQSVVNNSYIPKGMDSDYAAFLRQIAHQTVANLNAEKSN